MSEQPNYSELMDHLENTTAVLNGMRRQLINGGWTEEGAEQAIVTILDREGAQ